MKFACDQCQAQYTIADERVAGRSMTIRCKRCQHLITVTAPSQAAPANLHDESTIAIGHQTMPATLRGNSMPPHLAAAPTPAPAPPPRARARISTAPAQLDVPWFVSLDGNEVGPLTLPQARDWVAARVGHGEMHCWSEGFDDWMPVEKVSHFRVLVAPRPAEADPFASLPKREVRASQPPPTEDGDLNIGEVSRIVNLAELAKNDAANKARRTSTPLDVAAPAPRQTVMRAAVSMPPVSSEQVERAQEAMAEAKQHNRRASTAVLLVALVVALGATALILALAKPTAEDEAATVDAFASGTDELGRRVALPMPGGGTTATPGPRRGPGNRGGNPAAGGTTASGGGAVATTGPVRPDKVEVGPEAQQVSPLTADDVIAVSSRMQSGTRRCYERAQKEDPFFKAPKIIVRLVVSKSGEVTSVSLDKVAETTFGRCLASTIKKWSFRPSTEGLAIDLPMVFGQS